MREKSQKWHNDVLATFQAMMFETLVHTHSIVTDSIKSYVFENENGDTMEPLRGYIALKEMKNKKVKYFIEEEFYEDLPIRVEKFQELFLGESANRKSIIVRPLNPIPFRIKSERCFDSDREFIDGFANFEHSNPNGWTILKICSIMGYVGKTFLGVCSPSEFGKSGLFEILHAITQKSPVFQPRSIPGILLQITGDGNIVFDEVHQSTEEVKRVMENFTLQVAGDKPIYINGAMKSKGTKSKYNVARQSITFLYNLKSYYSKPNEEFFDYFFSNNSAIDSRLLKLKFDGKLIEKFDRNIDLIGLAESNKIFYLRIAKHLLYLKNLKQTNSYKRKFDYQSEIGHKLKGRRKQIYDEITWMVDMYCKDSTEYIKMISVLDKGITDYKEMANPKPVFEGEQKPFEVEAVFEDKKTVLEFMEKKKEIEVDDFLKIYTNKEMDILLKNGDIFHKNNHTLKLLE